MRDGSRRTLSLSELSAHYKKEGSNAAPPLVFVINLDHRSDRLNETLSIWNNTGLRIVRVSALRTRDNLNGCSLTHLSLILAMEEHGWPYVLFLEDDANVLQPQWDLLFPRVLAYVRSLQGKVGWINFGPSTLFGGLGNTVDGLLFSTWGMQAATGGIYGRFMVPAAHSYLDIIVDQPVPSRNDGAQDYAFGVSRTGLKRGEDLLVTAEHIVRPRASFSDIEGGKSDYAGMFVDTAKMLKEFVESLQAKPMETMSLLGTCQPFKLCFFSFKLL